MYMAKNNFNPRTREGCDPMRSGASRLDHLISIHAPVKGATRGDGSRWMAATYFNPRTREGCDNFPNVYLLLHDISIHAPVKGATITLIKLLM